MDMLAKYKKFLLSTIKQAGDAIINDYKNLDNSQIKLKTPRDLVTVADLHSEKIILTAIKEIFPDHQILSEESGASKNKGDYQWIVDPLDGTTNFVMHNPLWSISIALAYKGEIILGAIYAPLQKELFYAVLGQGAYLNNERIHVNNTPIRAIHAFCSGREAGNIERMIKYFTYQKRNSLDCRQLGSAAIELAYVAAGRIASIIIPGAWVWDVAAGALLVKEAGGKVTDFAGHDWKISERRILAADSKSHAKILKTLESIGI